MPEPTSPRPVALRIQREHIPDDLKALPQWVTWRYVWRKRKWDKPPRHARTGRLASSTDAKTWSAFDEVLRAYDHQQNLDGIGFVLTEDNGLSGIDLDHCRNPETGAIEPWAQGIVSHMQTYTEVSPSGTGLRVWLIATRPQKGRRQGSIEVYSWGRYLTCTGWHLDGTPPTIEARQAELEAFEAETFTTPPPAHALPSVIPPPHRDGPSFSDDDLLAKALGARNSGKFARLWSGDTTDYGGDDSRADLALCCELAFWNADDSQIDRLFRRSGLYREKWETRADYRDITITKALAGPSARYTPRATPAATRPPLRYRRPSHPWPTRQPPMVIIIWCSLMSLVSFASGSICRTWGHCTRC